MHIAVIAGGPSSEAAVSRASAQGVVAALRARAHRVELWELDSELPQKLAAQRPEVVFPVTHGTLGEDGCLQGLLEVLALPYVGSGVLASALAADKAACKLVLETHGVPVLPALTCSAVPDDATAALTKWRERLGERFVVKPVGGGSALGVSILGPETDGPALREALALALSMDATALVERFHRGHEITCAVLERAGVAEALPPTLIRAQAGAFYDFKSKYGTGGSQHLCPAPLPPALLTRIQACAVTAHRALGCRDLSRVDFVVPDDGDVRVLEVNTLPGMTKTSLFPEAAAAAGLPFEALCDALARGAAARQGRVRPQSVPLPD